MYTPAIGILIIGFCLLIVNIFLFLGDFKQVIADPSKKKALYLNGGVLLSIVGLLVLGTIYVFVINNQL